MMMKVHHSLVATIRVGLLALVLLSIPLVARGEAGRRIPLYSGASTSSFPSPGKISSEHLSRVVAARRRAFWVEWAQGGAPNSLARSVPAAIRRRSLSAASSSAEPKVHQVVSMKTRQITQQLKSKLPPPPPKDDTGFFYGFTVNMVKASTTDRPPATKKPSMKDAMALTLDEIRTMRVEMEALRKELQSLKQELAPASPVASDGVDSASPSLLTKKEAERFYERIGRETEAWANRMIKEGAEDGWVEIKCNKSMRKALNPEGTNNAFVKWMKDPRGSGESNPNDDREYPCLKCAGTINAPIEVVCLYLSRERYLAEYNDLVETHKDLQEITPSSKVCLGQTPQILFIKPRSLITYCQHRWLPDGTQLLVNQACRHPKKLTKENMGKYITDDELDDKRQPMAYAFRGANYIARHPDDPEHKTRITFLAHGNPGRDVPTWAMKTAVGALANLEPFKLFHRVNDGIQKKLPQLQEELEQAQLVSERPDGRTTRPAGIAQLGYACFWPNGGGVLDKSSTSGWGKPSSSTEDTGLPVDDNNEGGEVSSAPSTIPATAQSSATDSV
eukprot:CAMPEP_0172472478 /NCGR_PEP_ID=MMETSP1065-20121228/68355_1 /TAXON_ID=265537 /ORGANISM="Amphiprora paludosa, Strain CCMP125" /LENGTH=560 /DNA_ID=CAMNT_0013230617 /DNA_START=114 /DNA_END=1796 /DNA_ORIENTATION=+